MGKFDRVQFFCFCHWNSFIQQLSFKWNKYLLRSSEVYPSSLIRLICSGEVCSLIIKSTNALDGFLISNYLLKMRFYASLFEKSYTLHNVSRQVYSLRMGDLIFFPFYRLMMIFIESPRLFETWTWALWFDFRVFTSDKIKVSTRFGERDDRRLHFDESFGILTTIIHRCS
jgi:hypothetical protein